MAIKYNGRIINNLSPQAERMFVKNNPDATIVGQKSTVKPVDKKKENASSAKVEAETAKQPETQKPKEQEKPKKRERTK